MPQSLEKNAERIMEVLGQDGDWWSLQALHRATSIKVPEIDTALARLGALVQVRKAWGNRRIAGKREVVRQWRLSQV